MDFSKFKTSDWLKVGGGLGGHADLRVRLDWVKVRQRLSESNGPFDLLLDRRDLVDLLVVAAGVITVLLVSGIMKPGSAPWPLILVLGTGLGALAAGARLIFNHGRQGRHRGRVRASIVASA